MPASCSTLSTWGSAWGFGWGGPPFTIGGALPVEGDFTDFCVCGSAVIHLDSFSGVTCLPGDVAHCGADADGTYRLKSGDSSISYLFFDKAVGEKSTLDAVFTAVNPPVDLATSSRFMFIGLYDDALSCAGLFLSSAGIAYGASYNDSPLYIPSSEGLILPGETYSIRIVIDNDVRAVFVYLSPLAYAKDHGPKLQFVLPLLDSATAPPHEEGAYVAVKGDFSTIELGIASICMAPSALVDNFPPSADPGRDSRRIGLAPFALDGSGSKDPEGGPITYEWRVVALPPLSRHVSSGQDGHTATSVSGFVDKLYTVHAEAGADAFAYTAGDVLRLGSTLATIQTAWSDGDGAYFQVTEEVLPAGLSDQPFQIVRQDGLSSADTVRPLYSPDTYGVHRFQLRVSDAAFPSEWASTLVVIQRKEGATGIIPDTSRMWDYLSDTWRIVEDTGRLETLWSSVAQVLGGEMLRVWQASANVSLATIPRRIVRKWLSYDLLLREPFLELSRCTARFTGVTSTSLEAGDLAFEGETIVVYVPNRADLVEITVPQGGNTPTKLAELLQVEFDAQMTGMVVKALRTSATYWELLLLAPYPFITTAGTTALFTPGSSSTPLKGTNASRIDAYTLKVGVSLNQRGLVKGDMLAVLDSLGAPVTVRVHSVQDSPGDLLRFQRIRTLDPLPAGGTSWEVLVKCTSPQLRFWEGGVSLNDHAVLSVNGDLMRTPVVGVHAEDPFSIGITLDDDLADLLGVEGAALHLWGVYRVTQLPVGEEVMSIPTLAVNPWEGEEVKLLRQHIDFHLDTVRDRKMLIFREGLFVEGVSTPIVCPRLWAEETQLDNSPAIEANFGLAVGMPREALVGINNIDYLAAVRGLWFARAKGPRLANLRIATQILFGLPFAEERGIIQEIDPQYTQDRGRITITDKANPELLRAYVYPGSLDVEVNPATKKKYKVGDEVAQFAPLVQGVSIVDLKKDPLWAAPYVAQGALSQLQAAHLYVVEADVSAFSLSALLFIVEFLKKISPARTKPLFLVRMRDLDPDTVDVEESVEMQGILRLYESPHTKPTSSALSNIPNLGPREGSAAMFDQPDPSPPLVLSDVKVGVMQSKFDTDIDPIGADAPNAHTEWGWDIAALSPESLVSTTLSYIHAGGTIPTELEDELKTDQPLFQGETLLFGRKWVPAFDEDGIQLAGPVEPSGPISITAAEVRIVGWPPAAGRAYDVRLYKNGIAVLDLIVSHAADGTSLYYWGPAPAPSTLPGGPIAVGPGDELRVGIFTDTGERSDQRLRLVSVTFGEGVGWTSGGALSAGTYLLRRGLLG